MNSMKRLKKKLRIGVMGCGCALLCLAVAGFLLTGAMTGVVGWITGTARNIGVNVPKEIALPSLPKELGLPQSIKLPQLPVNPFKPSQQEQIALGNEVAAKQGLDKDPFADPKIKDNRMHIRLAQPLAAHAGSALPIPAWWRYLLHHPDEHVTLRFPAQEMLPAQSVPLPGA